MANRFKLEAKFVKKRDGSSPITYDKGDLTRLKSQINFIPENTVCKIEITAYNEKEEREAERTLKQNAYYHVLLDHICAHTGDEHMDMHMQLKVKLLSRPYVIGDKEYTIVGSTARLSTKNFAEYLEKVFKFASEEFGLVLPESSQYY